MKRVLTLAFLFFVLNTVLYSQNWEWQNPLPQGNTLRDVIFVDDQNGWGVGDLGTIIHTSDGGQNWNVQSSGTSNTLLSVHFTDPQNGWAVGSAGTILHTTNGGSSWDNQYSVVIADINDVFFIDVNHGWAVNNNAIILHTIDGGQNWSVQSSGYNLGEIHFIDNQNGWAVLNTYSTDILHTTNGGQTWNTQSISGTNVIFQSVYFTDIQNGWAVGGDGTILHTIDGGGTWEPQSSGTLSQLSDVHFTDSQKGWAIGYHGTIIYTTDGGATWQHQLSGTMTYLLGVHFTDDHQGWVVGTYGTILHTVDNGLTWQQQLSGSKASLEGVHFIDTQLGWAVGYDYTTSDGTILHTTDGGKTWQQQSSGTTNLLYDVHFADSQQGWAVGVEILHTIDGGATWQQQSFGAGYSLHDVYFTDSQRGWAVGEGGTIIHTTDGGTIWQQQSSGTSNSLYGVHFADSQRGWVVVRGGIILHTTDGGATWQQLSFGNFYDLFGVYFIDSQQGWVVGEDGRIFHTTDGGATWQQQSLGTVYDLQSVHFTDTQSGWIVGTGGYGGTRLYTTDGGLNWITQSSGTPFGLQSVYFSDSQNGWAVGDNGTIVKYSNSSWSTTPPKLTLSAAQLNPGQTLTFNGTDFTPNNTATIFITKPDGTEQEIDAPTNASGAFTYTYTAPNIAGSYSVGVKDVTSGKFTVNKVFQVTGTQPSVDYLKITSPVATDVFQTGSSISVIYSDKMFLSGSTYPIQGAYRLYRYKIEYSLNNGPWLGAMEQSGKQEVNQFVTLNFQLPAPVSAGNCRVRVTDMYNQNRLKISPIFTMQLAPPPGALEVAYEWDYSYLPRLLTTPIQGVAADGVGRFYIKVRKPNTTIQSVSVALSDASGGMTNMTIAKLGKVRKASVTNGPSYEANDNTGNIQAINDVIGTGGYFWFWYIAPEDFARNSSDYTKSVREVNAEITVNYATGAPETMVKKIKIVRPPVMLAHGLFGDDEDSWKGFKFSNNKLFAEDDRFEIKPKAIELRPAATFKKNAERLTNLNPGDYFSLPNLVLTMRKAGYACNQADYVCHSMGGSVIRYCISDFINGNPNPTQALFYRPINYGKGYAHKIITLNTPHNGSPIADLVYKKWLSNVNKFLETPLLRYFFFNAQIFPAIKDLQENGGIQFSETPVGSHIHRIASKIDCENFTNLYNSSLNKIIWTVLYDAYNFDITDVLCPSCPYVTDYPNCDKREELLIIRGLDPSFVHASDLVVSTKSQLAGDTQFETGGSKTLFKEIPHSTPFGNRILKLPYAADTTLFLLNQDLNNTFFSTLPKTPDLSDNNSDDVSHLETPFKVVYSNALKSNSKIKITNPFAGDTLTIDQSLSLSISVLDTVGFKKLTVFFQDEIYPTTTAASTVSFNIQINGNLIEKQKILAVGYYYTPDSGAVQYVDEIEVYITTNEPIAAFEASPQVNFLEKGENFRPTYTARFSTNIGELGNSPALTASIENPAVLAYQTDDNSFTAIDTGSTYAVVTYKGLSDTLFFLIISPPDSIIIDPPGSVSAAFTYQAIPCANAQATFTNTSDGATSYLWEFGDGNFSTLPNPTHQYAEPGAYNVILSATNNTTGETDLIVHTVNVANTTAVQAAISPTGNVSICDGDTVTLNANTGTGYTYQWLRNGNPVVNGNNQQYVAYQWGYFTVRVTDATGCSTVSAPTIITVTPAPTVSAALQGPAAICLGDSTFLKATSTSAITYQWFLNDVELPGATSTNLIATASGDYTVMATNSFSCTRMSFPVTVTQLPVPAITASADDNEICMGDAAVLIGSGGISYTWNPGNLSGETINVSPTVSTVYTVTGTGSNGCTASEDLAITVFLEPFVEIGNDTALSLNQVLHLDAGPGFSAYFWSTGATTQSIDFVVTQQLSLISVQVIDTNGCVGFDIILVEPLVGTKDIDKHKSFSMQLFPNPTSGILNIRIEKPDASFEEMEFSIFDMFGQVVLHQRQMLQSNKSMNMLDLSTLPSGSYAVQVNVGSWIVSAVVIRI